MNTRLIVIVIFIFISCGSDNKSSLENSNRNVVADKALEVNLPKENTSADVEINDILIYKTIETLNEISKDAKFTVSKRPIKNQHLETTIDTIITYSYNKTQLKSYVTKDKEFVFEAIIKNSDFQFLNGIGVGASKKNIEEYIGRMISSNKFILSNSENSNSFVFDFRENTIDEITFEGYLD